MSEVSTPLIEKKPFPEDRAIKLALAREKALEVRRKNSLARKKAELERMENQMNPPPPTPESVPEEEPPQEEPVSVTPEPAPSPPKVAPVKTKKQSDRWLLSNSHRTTQMNSSRTRVLCL